MHSPKISSAVDQHKQPLGVLLIVISDFNLLFVVCQKITRLMMTVILKEEAAPRGRLRTRRQGVDNAKHWADFCDLDNVCISFPQNNILIMLQL